MIIAILGNVGSGKSVSAVYHLLMNKKKSFCNFNVNSKKAMRIKKEHIIITETVGHTKSGKPITEQKINWDFWNKALKKHGEYHLFLDEIQNIVNARSSMSKNNQLMGLWISQIRKVLGNSEKTHIFLISQRLNRIDVAFRDLLHIIISCEKKETRKLIKTQVLEDGKLKTKILPEIWIIQYYFVKDTCVKDYSNFMHGYKTYNYRRGFLANNLFKFYDSYEIFGETAYL